MKIYARQFEGLLKSIQNGSIKAMLLYGPERGMVSSFERSIINFFALSPVSVNYTDINSEAINNYLFAANLFGKRELIKVINCSQTASKALQKALSKDYSNFLIFIADELTPASSLRKFFETEKAFISLACYVEEEAELKPFINNCLALQKLNASPKVLDYLARQLKGNRALVESEIEKLALYCYGKNTVTLEDCIFVITPNFNEYSADNMCIYFAQGKTEGFFHELERLLIDNIPPVWIIRALIRFHINLFMVKKSLEETNNIDSALLVVKPPLFFKILPDFKKLIVNLSIKQIASTIELLYHAESEMKQTGSKPENICTALFYKNMGSENESKVFF